MGYVSLFASLLVSQSVCLCVCPRPKGDLVPDPNVIHSWTQMPFGHGLKWGLVPDPNAIQSQTQVGVVPGPKCDLLPDTNSIRSRTQVGFGPRPKCESVPDPNTSPSWIQMQFGPRLKCEFRISLFSFVVNYLDYRIYIHWDLFFMFKNVSPVLSVSD